MDFYLTALLQALCLLPMALGIFISMKIFNIPDITTDGSFTLGGALTAVLLLLGYSTIVTFPMVMLAGALGGAITGLIHTRLKINPLLAGILVMTALYSVNLVIMGRSNLPLLSTATLYSIWMFVDDLNQNTFLFLALGATLFVAIIGYILKTDFGIAMRATGNSETMIRALGVNTSQMKVIGLAISNSLTAASGYLMVQFQGFADINMGIGIVITGLGSVIIADSLIFWLKVKSVGAMLWLVLLGAVLFQLVLAFTLSMGIDSNLLKLVTAVFVLLIVSIPRFFSIKAYD